MSDAWPTATLLISEVQTGGASASDELAELTNAGALPVDLMGLEVVYATSTGSTMRPPRASASALPRAAQPTRTRIGPAIRAPSPGVTGL